MEITTNKERYEAPSTTVFEVRQEGVICASDGLNDYDRQSGEDW